MPPHALHPVRSAIGGGVPKVEAASTATTVCGRRVERILEGGWIEVPRAGFDVHEHGLEAGPEDGIDCGGERERGHQHLAPARTGTGHRAERDHQPQRGVGDRDARDAWAEIAPEPLDEQLMAGAAVRVPPGLLGQREVRLDLTRRWDLRGLKADHRPRHSNAG